MFDSITFKNSVGPGPLLDIGAIAEALLFYGRVSIVGNSATVKSLLSGIPPFIALELLRDKRIEFYYLADQVAISSTPTGSGRHLHGLMRFSSPQHTIEKVGPEAFRAAAGNTGQARVGSSQFTRLIQPLSHEGFDQSAVLASILDHRATERSVSALLSLVAPGYTLGEPLLFRIEQQKEGFIVDTNLDFEEANAVYRKTVPVEHSSLSEAYLLALMQGAYEATYYAATLNSEVAVAPVERVVQSAAIESIVQRRTKSEREIDSFIELTMNDARTIREAVNTGRVPFVKVVKLLDSADKFRHWLHQQPVDAELVKTYYQAVVSDSWADKLPAKSARWAIFTGLGVAADSFGTAPWGTIGGVAISAVDSFLCEKLLAGWKPHQFIEGDLKTLFMADPGPGKAKTVDA
ncbi:hypothetical protein [Hydrogenophaga sp.]|uniref:hypothetical protein n=1 Tax=Hydrogenophaga sp. TaxID=1904254 RepID=UPI0035AEBC0F